MQNFVWLFSVGAIAVVGTIFLWVAAGASRSGGEATAMARTAYRWRRRLFWLAIVAGAGITFSTLGEWPIPGHAVAANKADVVIRAVGHQWRWEIDRDTVQVGQLVEFHVSAADVNHGFAIYKGKHHIITQTQAMPGYVNKLQVRFTEPGDYELLCLEYCGVAHHGMRAVIKVREAS
jgi:cytochrome c oxidase subunit 2